MIKELENEDKDLFMEMEPRCMITYAILYRVASYLFVLLFLRLYIATKLNAIGCSIIAVLATFISTSETEVLSQIKSPSSTLMIFVSLKSIKCILIIVVLSFNGNVNDYLILFYFLVTAATGTIFFKNSGL